MIITVTMNPAVDKTAYVDSIVVGGLNRLANVISSPGGKGINVSKTIDALRGDSIATGFVAGNNGDYITKYLEDANIKNDMVNVDGNTRVNLKVLDKDMELTELNEVGPSISAPKIQELKEKILSLVSQNDIVVLSGSVPNGVEKTIYKELITVLKEKQIKVVLDADGELFRNGMEAYPNVIKPNKYEICKHFDVDENISQEKLIELGQKLLSKGVDLVVISMGKEGAIFIDENQVGIAKGLKIKADSSVGAGDAMVAALAYAMDQKMNFIDMATLAMATSAGACITKGTQPASLNDVQELMWQVEIDLVEAK